MLDHSWAPARTVCKTVCFTTGTRHLTCSLSSKPAGTCDSDVTRLTGGRPTASDLNVLSRLQPTHSASCPFRVCELVVMTRTVTETKLAAPSPHARLPVRDQSPGPGGDCQWTELWNLKFN